MLISIATWDRKRARVRPCVPLVSRVCTDYRVMYPVYLSRLPPGAPPDLSKRDGHPTRMKGPHGVRWGDLKVVVQ